MKIIVWVVLIFLCACGPNVPQYLGGEEDTSREMAQDKADFNFGKQPDWRAENADREAMSATSSAKSDSQYQNKTLKEPGGAAVSTCPKGCTTHVAGCDIKGNISVDTKKKIYHIPGGAYYDKTVIDSRYGERWFCTEAEAMANNWFRSLK